MREIVRNDYYDRVNIGLDYFDASINRISAWVIGMRNARRALLIAALEPHPAIKEAEESGDYGRRLGLIEEAKTLPFGPVWDYYCRQQNVPVGADWLERVAKYEKDVLSTRLPAKRGSIPCQNAYWNSRTLPRPFPVSKPWTTSAFR